MPSLDVLLAFFTTALFLAAAPGPDIIFVLAQAALFGAGAGVATTAGLVTGVFFQTLAAALGVAALVAASPLAFNFIKLAGAAYLCRLAWLSFRAGASRADLSEKRFPGYWALYGRGVIMNVTNPKVCLFFLAFLSQFCDPASPASPQMILLGGLFALAAAIVFVAVALLGGKLALWFNKYPKSQIFMHRASALIFLALAAAVVFMDRQTA